MRNFRVTIIVEVCSTARMLLSALIAQLRHLIMHLVQVQNGGELQKTTKIEVGFGTVEMHLEQIERPADKQEGGTL